MYVRRRGPQASSTSLGPRCPGSYDKMGSRKTNENLRQVFPVVLNVAHPQVLRSGLSGSVTNNKRLKRC